MKNLYIVGARGFGREVYILAKESIGYKSEFEIKGFLDDRSSALEGYCGYPEIISSVEAFTPTNEDVFVIALGDVQYKKRYAEILLAKGAKFQTLIHKDAHISQNVKMGKGCIVCAHARLSCDVAIGNFNTFQPFSVAGHDVKVSNYCHFNTYSFMGGYVEIEDEVTLHTGAIVHPHRKVKKRSIIGAGAVVLQNVPESTTMFGNPAKKIIY